MGVSRRGDVWYVKWKTAEGRWRRRRTAARTKAEAQVYFAELVRQADRARFNLEHQAAAGLRFWELCEWWLENRCRPASRRRARSMLSVHIRRTRMGSMEATSMTHQVFDAFFEELAGRGYAPRTINQLRLVLMGIFSRATKAGRWSGANPLKATASREVSSEPRPILKTEEVEPVLAKVPAQWRGFFACGVYMGLRKGEICGLLKSDYNPVARTLYVGRSYAAPQTKGKRVDHLPVTAALAAHLERALESPGPYLFPGPGGKMRNENCAPDDILKVALRRADLVEGWRHKCRRCKHRGEERTFWDVEDDEPRHCPQCKFKLWPVAIPRPLRFHDLRHTAATHLLQAGVPVQHVQRILRHSSINITVGTYGHLLTEDLRPALEKLGPQPAHVVPLRPVSGSKD